MNQLNIERNVPWADPKTKSFLFTAVFLAYSGREYLIISLCFTWCLQRVLVILLKEACYLWYSPALPWMPCDLWPFAPEHAESALCSIDPTFDSGRLTQEWVGKAGEWIEKEKVHATLNGVRCPLCAIIHTQAKCVHSRSCCPSWCLVHVKVKKFTFLTRLRGEVKVLNVTIMNSPLPQTMIPQKTCFFISVLLVDFGGNTSTEFWRKLLTTELTQKGRKFHNLLYLVFSFLLNGNKTLI